MYKIDKLTLNNILAANFKFNNEEQNKFSSENKFSIKVDCLEDSNKYKIITMDKSDINNILNIFKDYFLVNSEEILKFVLYNDSLDYIQKITPIIKKYYPNNDYHLEFIPDLECFELSVLLLSIRGVSTPYEDNFHILKEIRSEFRKCNFNNSNFKKNFLVDVW